MSTTSIKQIITGNGSNQTIKQIVRSGERGATGPQGPQGLQGPQGPQGPRGWDGAIQYKAGAGINIGDDNTISATGEAIAAWGGIIGNINNQTDLQNKFAQYTPSTSLSTVATTGSYNDLTNKPTIGNAVLTVQSDGDNVGSFSANSTNNTTLNVVPPVRIGSTVSVPNATVQLADKNGANIYPVSNYLSDGTVTTNSISNGAVTGDKIDFTTMTGTGVIRFGNLKIMWGSDTVSSVANNTDKAKTVQFPESFNSVPSVTVTVSGWLALRMCVTDSTTVSQTNVVVNHSQGSTINVPFNWIAIG